MLITEFLRAANFFTNSPVFLLTAFVMILVMPAVFHVLVHVFTSEVYNFVFINVINFLGLVEFFLNSPDIYLLEANFNTTS